MKSLCHSIPGQHRRLTDWTGCRPFIQRRLSESEGEWIRKTAQVRVDRIDVAIEAAVASKAAVKVNVVWDDEPCVSDTPVVPEARDSPSSGLGTSTPLTAPDVTLGQTFVAETVTEASIDPGAGTSQADWPDAQSAGAGAGDGAMPSVDKHRGHVPVKTTLQLSNGRSITLQNREVDGRFRRADILKAWTSEYFGKKAMSEQIEALGREPDHVVYDTTGAWVSPALARAMAKTAGLSDSQVHQAFNPEGVEAVSPQPQLEGEAGGMLTKARVLRPRVPGVRRSVEFVKSLDGMILRVHGRYIDASLLLKSVHKHWSEFWSVDANVMFFDALMNKRAMPWSDLVIFETSNGIFEDPPEISSAAGISRGVQKWTEILQNVDMSKVTGIWVDFGLGVKMASWANKKFEVEVYDLVVRYMQNQISSAELDATQSLLSRFKGHHDATSPFPASETSSGRGDESVTAFCGRTCTQNLGSIQIMPVPGISTDLPSMDVMKRHGNYFFVLGTCVWRGVTILLVKPGASFHGAQGMYRRYVDAAREFPHLSVMFMEPSTATVARDGETAMNHSLMSAGNAFQCGATERWVVTVAAGMHPADAARALATRMHTSLPIARLDPASAPVPDEIARAFRAAATSMASDDACGVKGRMWADDTGHRYHVEIVKAENELAKHKVDKRAETEMHMHTQKLKLDSLDGLLRDKVITTEEYFKMITSMNDRPVCT